MFVRWLCKLYKLSSHHLPLQIIESGLVDVNSFDHFIYEEVVEVTDVLIDLDLGV